MHHAFYTAVAKCKWEQRIVIHKKTNIISLNCEDRHVVLMCIISKVLQEFIVGFVISKTTPK